MSVLLLGPEARRRCCGWWYVARRGLVEFQEPCALLTVSKNSLLYTILHYNCSHYVSNACDINRARIAIDTSMISSAFSFMSVSIFLHCFNVYLCLASQADWSL